MRSIADEITNTTMPAEDLAIPEAPEPEPEPWWQRLVSAETGDGELAEYTSHPLNVTGEAWNARLARGVTGLFGNLRLAVVDIAMAVVEMWWNKRRGAGSGNGTPTGA